MTIEKGIDSKANTMGVKEVVEGAVPEASVLSNVSSEMTFRLPLDASDRFPGMFTELDKKIDSGEISTYGVGITTLDEVFLQVARGETTDNNVMESSQNFALEGDNGHNSPSQSYRSQDNIPNNALFAVHVRSLFAKRALYFKRDKKAWACSTLLPVLFSFFGFINVTLIAPSRNMQPLQLKPTDYAGINNSKIAFPINEPDTFACQPAKCLGSQGGNFYESDSYCGNIVSLNDRTEQCSAVAIDGFSDGLDSSLFLPITQDVSSVFEVSSTCFLTKIPSD